MKIPNGIHRYICSMMIWTNEELRLSTAASCHTTTANVVPNRRWNKFDFRLYIEQRIKWSVRQQKSICIPWMWRGVNFQWISEIAFKRWEDRWPRNQWRAPCRMLLSHISHLRKKRKKKTEIWRNAAAVRICIAKQLQNDTNEMEEDSKFKNILFKYSCCFWCRICAPLSSIIRFGSNNGLSLFARLHH